MLHRACGEVSNRVSQLEKEVTMTSGKMGRCCRLGRSGLLLVLGLALVLMTAFASARVERGKENEDKEKLRVGPGFSQAMLATQLALKGERMRSPILMLAAAELLMDLKESGKSTQEIKMKGEGGDSSIKLTPADLVQKAKRFAGGDKDLSALVEKRAEQLSSRGLAPSVGEKLQTIKQGGYTFKLLGGGKIPARGEITLGNIPFVAGKPAIIAAGGENHQNLVVEVRDEAGTVIRNPSNVTSRVLTIWLPANQQTVSATVRNEGDEEIVALIANWD
jgi:hypothetical protein